ncbi:hypothetical protein H1R20_g1910, partial [Candolleomyces eurysporus]
MAQTRESETKGLKFMGYPNWRQVLKDAGLSDGWIDDIVRSPVGNYEWKVPRVGCILKVIDAHPDQPANDWFLRYNIPIWYRRRGEEGEWMISLRNPRSEAVVNEEGSVERDLDKDLSGGEDPNPNEEEPDWMSFFKSREAKYPHILATESGIDRQRRETRIQQRPVRKAAVFEWLQKGDDSNRWERIPVTNKCKMDTLASYRRHQIRYDPFFNEWDCCEKFTIGDLDDDSSDEEDWEGPVVIRSMPVEEVPMTGVEPTPDLFGPAEDATGARRGSSPSFETLTFIELEVEEVFGKYYGFCAPVIGTPLPDLSTTDDRSADRFIHLLGSEREIVKDDEYFQSYHYKLVQLFLESMIELTTSNGMLSDMDDSSLQPVRLLPRFSTMAKLDIRGVHRDIECLDASDFLYVFEPQNAAVPWKVATFSPITALLICRLPASYTETSIVYYLAQRGIPFRVLHPLPRIQKLPPKPVVHALPVRKWDHQFTREDYDSYVNQRTYLLGQPHMQATLRRGGIAWRLAIEALGIAEVVKEPTLWGHRFSPTSTLVEDTVTTVELDLLCGAYECISDDGKKRALKSWWPLVRYYEKQECGENHGHWSSRNEEWFTKRVFAIESQDTPQPLSYTGWKSKLHGVKGVRNFLSTISRASETLISKHAPTLSGN